MSPELESRVEWSPTTAELLLSAVPRPPHSLLSLLLYFFYFFSAPLHGTLQPSPIRVGQHTRRMRNFVLFAAMRCSVSVWVCHSVCACVCVVYVRACVYYLCIRRMENCNWFLAAFGSGNLL